MQVDIIMLDYEFCSNFVMQQTKWLMLLSLIIMPGNDPSKTLGYWYRSIFQKKNDTNLQ
jgi:hypothetical protein